MDSINSFLARNKIIITLGSFWLSVVCYFMSYHFENPKIPQILTQLTQNYPTHTQALIAGITALFIAMIGSILILRRQKISLWFLPFAVLSILTHDYLLGPQAVFPLTSLFHDTSYLLFGIVFGIVLQQYNIINLRLLRIFCISAATLSIAFFFFNSHLPAPFQSFEDQSSLNGILILVVIISVLGRLIGYIGLTSCWRGAKYLFTAAALINVVGDLLLPTSVNHPGFSSCIDNLNTMLDGLILFLIYSKPLSNPAIDFKKYNPFRIAVLALFSKKVYQEAVIDRKGKGLLLLLLTIYLIHIPIIIMQEHYWIKNTLFLSSDAKYLEKQMPNFIVAHGILSMQAKSPYYLYDAKKNPVVVIDATQFINDYNSQLPQTIHLVIAKDGYYYSFYKRPHPFTTLNSNQFIKTLRANAFLGTIGLFIGYYILGTLITFGVICLIITALARRPKLSIHRLGGNSELLKTWTELDYYTRIRLLSLIYIVANIAYMVMKLFQLNHPILQLSVIIAIYYGYSYFALNAIKEIPHKLQNNEMLLAS